MAGFYENDGDAGNTYGAAASASAAEAKGWAIEPEDTLVPEGNLVDEYSSLHYSKKAAASSSGIQAISDAAQSSADASAASAVLANASDSNAAASASSASTNLGLTNADVVLTNADVVSTNADVALTGLDVVATNADVLSTNANVLLTNADVVSTNADVVLTTADAAATAADLLLTDADTIATAADASSASVSATNAATSETNSALSETAAALSAASAAALPSRNSVQNQDPVSQGTATRSGMSSTIYTGNGSTQSVATGVDMDTGDFGGLVWTKKRDSSASHGLQDSVRGVAQRLYSDLTLAEDSNSGVTSFDTNGFTVDGLRSSSGASGTYVAWSWQTTEKTTGTTNRNKAYTCHYNADLGFSIVGYIGDGVDGHEIPHFLGKEPELTIFKSRGLVENWVVFSSLFSYNENLFLNATNALAVQGVPIECRPSRTTLAINDNAREEMNTDTEDYIAYNFTSIPNVCKIDTYKGTGAAGNYVDCGFKAAWVMVKNLTSGATNWVIFDGSRTAGNYLLANTSASDGSSASLEVQIVDGGFVAIGNNVQVNGLNDEYIFMAYAEGTAFDSTKTLTNYPYATTDEVLTINSGTLMSFAEGFNAAGQVDTQELVGAGVTLSFGAGYENQTRYVYKDKGTTFDSTEYRNLEGISRAQADKFGLVSPLDVATRTTDKHFGYESATGVALASGEFSTNLAWGGFDKAVHNFGGLRWIVAANTLSWLQYKFVEPRVLKSWRFKSTTVAAYDPKRFTIEGSNDGFTWTAIDSTYTAADYTGNGASLWGDLQDTSANTTAYVYTRINTTANNGDATYTGIEELEFNTITPSDYLNVVDGLVYNNAGTVIDRVYLAKIMTGASGELLNYENLPVAKIKGVDAEYQGDLTVHGDIVGANLFGQDQTWQDVTAERALSVTYTNNTGRPIEIVVVTNFNTTASGNALVIDGIVTNESFSSGSGTIGFSLQGIVPNGSTYSVGTSKGLRSWDELRGINS